MKTAHLGCGTTIISYADNYDKYPCDELVKHLDMDVFPYPIPNNTYDVVICRHVLEHLTNNPYDVMMELHRICKPHGRVIVELPIFGNLVSHQRHLHSRNYMNPLCKRTTNKDCNYIQNHYVLVRQDKTNKCSVKKILWKLKTRFLTWVDSYRYDGYEWCLEVKK